MLVPGADPSCRTTEPTARAGLDQRRNFPPHPRVIGVRPSDFFAVEEFWFDEREVCVAPAIQWQVLDLLLLYHSPDIRRLTLQQRRGLAFLSQQMNYTAFTGGFKIENGFGADADFAQVIKVYTQDLAQHPERKYSAPDFVSNRKIPVLGDPDMDLACTSHIERLNGITRQHMRRLSRLTLAFSKKLENFEAAVALHFAYYNLVRTHGSLKMTPAMFAGIDVAARRSCDVSPYISSRGNCIVTR